MAVQIFAIFCVHTPSSPMLPAGNIDIDFLRLLQQPLLLAQAMGLWPNTTFLFYLLLYLLSLGVSAVYCQAYITTTTRLEIRLQHRTSSSTICNLSLYRRHLAITRLWNTLLGELEDTALGERCRIYRRSSYMEYSTGGARNSCYLQSFTLGRPVF